MTGSTMPQGSIFTGERAIFHFFGIVFLLGAVLVMVLFVNHWNKVGALHKEVIHLRKEVVELQDKVNILEIKVATEELLNKPHE